MKFGKTIGTVAVALSLVGCARESEVAEEPSEVPRPTGRQYGERPTAESPQAATNLQSRSQFIAHTETMFRQVDESIKQWTVKAGTLAAEAKTEATEALNVVTQKRDDMKKKLEEIKGASEQAWQSQKDEANNLMKQFHQALDAARAKFGDQPAATPTPAPSPQSQPAEPEPGQQQL